jgi:hypothetical protein
LALLAAGALSAALALGRLSAGLGSFAGEVPRAEVELDVDSLASATVLSDRDPEPEHKEPAVRDRARLTPMVLVLAGSVVLGALVLGRGTPLTLTARRPTTAPLLAPWAARGPPACS